MHASALILFPPAPACPAELQTFPDMRHSHGHALGLHPACCLPRAASWRRRPPRLRDFGRQAAAAPKGTRFLVAKRLRPVVDPFGQLTNRVEPQRVHVFLEKDSAARIPGFVMTFSQ